MSESDRGFGRRTGKAPERSNFAQACNLLSQFLKENRNLGNPETKEKSETNLPSARTMNFLTNIEGLPAQNGVASLKSSDFFQKIVGFGAEDSNKPDLRPKTTTQGAKQEGSSQMTIFYSGQVLVFNDLPTDRADEIIGLARKGSSNVSGSVSNPVVVETIDLTKSSTPEAPDRVDVASNKVIALVPKNKSDMIIIDINKSTDDSDCNNNDDDNNNNNNSAIKSSTNKTLQQRPTEPANGSDLPIARRNSLHRFLEKRKDRVGSKAPYQVVPNRAAMAPRKPDEGSSQGGECSDKQLELKL